MHSKLIKIPSSTDVPIFHVGPHLSLKPLPAFIYFALSGEESLGTPPYNEPITLLQREAIHCFSFTLPAHGHGFENKSAISQWAKDLEKKPSLLNSFIESCKINIQNLIDQGYIDPKHIAVGGLSRGGFIATHLAAKDNRIKTILGYAPLTDLAYLDEFKALPDQSLVHSLSLEAITGYLTKKKLRFYIGNRDTRVGTVPCFNFINKLVEEAHIQGLRSADVELIISPSVGHKGHGTLPPVFASGVEWLKKELNL